MFWFSTKNFLASYSTVELVRPERSVIVARIRSEKFYGPRCSRLILRALSYSVVDR